MSKYSISIVAIFVSVLVLSCSKPEKKNKGFTEEEFNATLDSIKKESIKKIQKESQENLDRILSIELKPMVDSILQRIVATPTIVLPEDRIDTTSVLDDEEAILEQKEKPLKPVSVN